MKHHEDQHPLLDEMRNARRFRLSEEADHRILDSLRQTGQASAGSGFFNRTLSRKFINNWRPVAAACLAVCIVGGAIGVGWADGGFRPPSVLNGPVISSDGTSASGSSSPVHTPVDGLVQKNSAHLPATDSLQASAGQGSTVLQQDPGSQNVSIVGIKSMTDPNASDSATQTFVKSVAFSLSNGQTVHLSTKDLLWSLSMANRSIIATTIPGTNSRFYALGLMTFSHMRWTLQSFSNQQLGVSDNTQSLSGLSLPKGTKFTGGYMPFGNANQGDAWSFYTSSGMFMTAKFPQTAFSTPNNATHFTVAGADAWLVPTSSDKASFAYMIDQGYILAVGGNLTPAQSKALLESLPPATASTFPFWH